jgi:hypothetical protein
MPETRLLAGCEVGHIVSRKHGGRTDFANLALSCARCNRAKGSDIGSIHPASGEFVRLFNPRSDRWIEHFANDEARIIGLTPLGEVTTTLLRFNDNERVLERALLVKVRGWAK